MTTTITHWAAGARYDGTQRPLGRGHQPGERPGHRPGRARVAERRRPRDRRGARAPPRSGARTSLARRTQVVFAFRELLNARADELARAHHRRARQGPVRRGRRDRPRPGGGRVRLRDLAPAQGRPLRERLHRRRRAQQARPARRGRHHLARSTSRRWCRCGSSRSRSPPATPWSSSPARRTRRPSLWIAELWQEAGLPDGVFNVLQGDKVAVDALLQSPLVEADQLRRLDADRAVRLRAGLPARQAGPGARRRQEPHGRAARRRPRPGRRLGGQRRLRQRRRAVHGDQRAGRGRGRRRRAGGPDRRPDPDAASSATVAQASARRREADMGPLVTRAHRDRVAAFVDVR